MITIASRRRLLPLLIALASVTSASCDESGTVTPPPPPSTLQSGLYFMHTANDSALSTAISTRFVGVTEERAVLDSSQLTVFIGGTYQQKYWVSISYNGTFDRVETVLDDGTWSLAGFGYQFASSVRTRTFSVTVQNATSLTTIEPMLFYAGAPTVSGRYRTTRP